MINILFLCGAVNWLNSINSYYNILFFSFHCIIFCLSVCIQGVLRSFPIKNLDRISIIPPYNYHTHITLCYVFFRAFRQVRSHDVQIKSFLNLLLINTYYFSETSLHTLYCAVCFCIKRFK